MIREQDLRVDIYRSGTVAVRVTHLPTGLIGVGSAVDSVFVARDLALLELVPKLRKAGVEFPSPENKPDARISTFESLLRYLNAPHCGPHTGEVR